MWKHKYKGQIKLIKKQTETWIDLEAPKKLNWKYKILGDEKYQA